MWDGRKDGLTRMVYILQIMEKKIKPLICVSR